MSLLRNIFFSLFIYLLTSFSTHAQNPYPTAPSVGVLDQAGKLLHLLQTSDQPLDAEPILNGGFCVTTLDGNLTVYSNGGTIQFQHRIIAGNDVDVLDENTFLLTSRGSKQIMLFQRQSLQSTILPFAFEGPSDTDVLPNGNFLVCDAQGQRIVEMTPAGKQVWEFNAGLRQPLDALRLSNGNTLISDFDNHRVIEVQPDGNIRSDFRGYNHPQKIYPLNDYEFLVADSDNQRVVKLNLNGEKQVIQNQLNYVLSAVFHPSQQHFLCSIQNRFPPPDTETASSIAQIHTTTSLSSWVNRYTFSLIALILGIVLWLNRSNAEWACLAFIAFYLILFGVGYVCITEAASRYPYQPGWLFFGIAVTLAASVAKDTRKVFHPVQKWLALSHSFLFPFSWSSIGFLILIPLLAMIAQYYHWIGFKDGTRMQWYVPMLLWFAGVYVFFRQSIFVKNEKNEHAQSPAPFTTGSVSQECEEEDEACSMQPKSILDSQEWRQLINPALLILFILCACLYTIDAASIPTDVHGDEAEVAMHGIEVRDSGSWNIFNPNWYLIPNLFFLIPAWVMWLFGDHLFGMRMAGAIVGIITIPVFYLFARRLLLPFPALIAVFLFAVSTMFVHFSRMGTGYNQATFITVTMLYFLLRGVQEHHARSVQLSGFMAGLGLLSYQAAQVLAPLGLVSLAALLIMLFVHSRFQYPVLWNGIKMAALFTLGVWITFAPLFGNYLKEPGSVFSRTKAVSMLHEDGKRLMRYNFSAAMTLEDIVKEQFRRTTFAPITYPDLSPYLKNNQHGGMLDPVPALLFSSGFILLFFMLWHPAAVILLLWYALLLYPTAITNSAPAYQRLVCVMPILFIIAAPVLSAIFSQAVMRLRTVPYIKISLLCCVTIIITVLGMNRYFHQIMSVPQTLDDHTRVALHLHKTGPTVYTYLFGRDRFSINYGTIRFLAPDIRGMDVENPESFVESVITQTGPIQFLFVGKDVSYASAVQAKYPGGKLEHHYNMLGQVPFITYQINR